MNVYEEAHALERAIKASEEFKQYDDVRKRVAANEQLDSMLKDFREKQMQVQAKQMMGEEVTEDMMKSVQDLYAIVAADPLAAEYLQCEMRFTVMIQDVFKIINDAIEVV